MSRAPFGVANGRRTGDQRLAREINRSLILRYVSEAGPTSVSSVARATGLNRTTVYSQSRELLEQGWLVASSAPTSQPGRPGASLRLNPGVGYIVGAELSATFLHVILTDLAGHVVDRWRRPSRPEDGQATVLGHLQELIAAAVATARTAGRRPLGVGVAVPGLVDAREGRIQAAVNLGWSDVPVGALLRDRFDCPVYVENDAQAALLGEIYFGGSRGIDDLIYASAGVGIAFGLLLHGEIYRGADGFAGEGGHAILLPDGPVCGCGNRGCLEALASERALVAAFARGRGHDPAAATLEDAVASARDGDPAARAAFQLVGGYLGIAVLNLVHLFNPARVVVGGRLASAGELLLEPIRAELARRVVLPPRDRVQVVLADLGNDSAALGAASTVLHRAVSGPRILN